MTPDDPAGGSGGDDDVPPSFADHVKIQFGQVKALVYWSYGQFGIDCEAITRDAFAHALELWPMRHPVTFTRNDAMELAAEATRGLKPNPDLIADSVLEILGPIASLEERAALAAVDRLPDTQRLVFLCVEVFQLPNAQIAEMLGCSETNVRVNLHLARKRLGADYERLRKLLDRAGEES